MSNDHLPAECSVLLWLSEFKEGSDAAAGHHSVPNREAHLSFWVIHQPKPGMESRSSEVKGFDKRSSFTAHTVPSITGRKHECECELGREWAFKERVKPLTRVERAAAEGQLWLSGEDLPLLF